jgi:DNA-binding transcriptional ArsR family regulator
LITFRFTGEPAESVAFAYSPLLETVLSLHVLREPKHHPLQHEWVRRMRGLPPDVKRDVARFGFLYRGLVTELVTASGDAGYRSFDEELELLRACDAAEAALGMLRPVWDHGGKRDARLLRRPRVREGALATAALLEADVDLVAGVFDRPLEVLEEFAGFLQRYWDVAFEDEWSAMEPRLADAVGRAGREIATRGLFDYLRGLSPQLLIDAKRRELRRDLPHEHLVEVGPGAELVLVPSVFAWPHVLVNCDPPWPPGIVFPAPFLREETRVGLPPAELADVLRALADDTRLRALRLIAAKPRSTQELAPLVGISEAGLSKHLRLLARTGLLTTRRDGYYVLYSLDRGRIEPLSETLLRFLGA